MSKEGFFSIDGENVETAENLEDIMAIHAAYDPESTDGTPTANRGKHTAGVSYGLLFAPFSTYQETSPPFPTLRNYGVLDEENPEAGVVPQTEEEFNIYSHYMTKYKMTQCFIVSDENLADEPSDRHQNECFSIKEGFHDTENMRPIALDGPVFISGFGINSSGRMFNNDEIGPLDVVFNKKRGYWEHRHKFPVAGRIKSSDGNSLYTVEVVGLVRDGTSSWDLNLASTGVSNICGEEDKYELTEVYGVEETDLTAGQFVTVFYDARSDATICIAGGGGEDNPPLAIDGVIGDNEGVEIDIEDNKIITKISYADIDGVTCLNFETDCLRVIE